MTFLDDLKFCIKTPGVKKKKKNPGVIRSDMLIKLG